MNKRVVELTILGEPASKANSREFYRDRNTGKMKVRKSDKALAYVKAATAQVRTIEPLLDGEVGFDAAIYYASNRPDLDESLILDVLQGRIYRNDRQVREKHIYHGIDKKNPRAEITIWERGC